MRRLWTVSLSRADTGEGIPVKEEGIIHDEHAFAPQFTLKRKNVLQTMGAT